VKVSIIIVNRHSKEQVRRCVGSLWQYCRGARPEVIVVDNGSFDGCREMLSIQFPSVVHVQSDTTLGSSAASNLGVKRASGTHLFFLHPETELFEDSVSILMGRVETLNDAGALGCQLVNADRSLRTECVRSFPTLVNQVLDSEYLRERFPDSSLWGQRVLHAKWPRYAEVEVVSDACLLVRRSCFDEVGGFSDTFAAFGADADLCFKLRKSGVRVYHIPETGVTYFGPKVADPRSPVSNVMVRESIFQFMRLHYGRPHALAYRAAMAMSALVRLFLIPPMMPLGKVIVRHGRGSWNKWMLIFRWSVGGWRSESGK
jgi:GT2 family glycosyltransferase